VGHYRSEEQQRENLRKQGGESGSTARGENAWLVVILKEGELVPEGAEVLKVRCSLPFPFHSKEYLKDCYMRFGKS
jgi:hypothetical protein